MIAKALKKIVALFVGGVISFTLLGIFPCMLAEGSKQFASWLFWPCILIGFAVGAYFMIMLTKSKALYLLSIWADLDTGNVYKDAKWYKLEKKREEYRKGNFNSLIGIISLSILFISCTTQPPQPTVETYGLYPVKGKILKATNYMEVRAWATSRTGQGGKFEISFPNNELVKGHWTALTAQAIVTGSSSSMTNTSTSASLYGVGGVSRATINAFSSMHGSSVARVIPAGYFPVRGIGVSPEGRRIEYVGVVASGSGSGYGTATDNKGNVFKVVY